MLGNAVATVNNARQEIVNFHGDALTAIQDPAGDIWVVANEVLRFIGFDEKKVDNQRYAWSKDIVICRGTKILDCCINGRSRDVFCINRRYIPLALAKISITPTMRRDQPKVVEKLIQYQEECADVLYNHFYNKNTPDMPLTREEMAAYFTYMMGAFRDYSAAIDRRDRERELLLSSLAETQSEVNRRMIGCVETVGTAVNTITSAISSLTNVFDSLKKVIRVGGKKQADVGAESKGIIKSAKIRKGRKIKRIAPGDIVAAEIHRIPTGGVYRYVRVYNKMYQIGGVDVRVLARNEAERLGVNKVPVSHVISKDPALMTLLRNSVNALLNERGQA